jgi:hypothetical protein
MAEGHGWGGASRADSNHPAPACASAAPPYPRRGVLLVLMSPCLAWSPISVLTMLGSLSALSSDPNCHTISQTQTARWASVRCFNKCLPCELLIHYFVDLLSWRALGSFD